MGSALPDVFCFSHLRWDFVFQRPHHLMTRYASEARVFYVEEPVFVDGAPSLHVREVEAGVQVLTPHVPASGDRLADDALQRDLLERFGVRHAVRAPVAWFYTPMALDLAAGMHPSLVVYDCMDELSGFLGAPPALVEREARLFDVADVVFTGGQSLYESKRGRHPNVHAFPSSVDAEHFRAARSPEVGPRRSGSSRPRPRIGFFGVIDERLDVPLLDNVAAERPDFDFVMVGPTVKIDPSTLPVRPNIHYRGPSRYADLPAQIAGWDVAMMPFARNDATRFISPTKTLEYMAAGKPIVSTSIRDVVRPYGEAGLVRVADDPAAFASAIDAALDEDGAARVAAFDAFLARTSWGRTWQRMRGLLRAGLDAHGKRGPRDERPAREAESA